MQPPHYYDTCEFFANYEVNEELGRGKFSIVKRCTGKNNKHSFAIKIIKSTQTDERENKFIKQEIDILRQLNHRNIVRIHEVYTDLNQTFLILDYLSGGELFDDIIKRSHYTESDASMCIQQILEAINHCHDHGIVHRDVKPENLLLTSKTKNSWIKLADFGIAVQLKGSERNWFGFAGTPGYLSPEIIHREEYGRGIDIWACGVILYILLCGYPPFFNEDQRDLFRSISECRYEFHPREWDSVTPDAKELIVSMLEVDQNKRPSADRLLAHPWIKDRCKTASNFNRQETVASLKRFNAKRKLKGAVHSIMAINRLVVDTGEVKDDEISTPPSYMQATSCLIPTNRDPSPAVKKRVISTDEIEKEILDLTKRLVDSEAISSSDLTCENSTLFQSGVPCLVPYKDKHHSSQTLKNTILHPTFHVMSQEVVCIAYVLVSSSQENLHANVKSFKETRVWQKTRESWVCIHCHSSEV